MADRILIPLFENEVAPRFDQATEVLIAVAKGRKGQRKVAEEKVIVLSKPSAEELCQLAFKSEASLVICSAIEERYHQYLSWKRIKVIDNVMGSVDLVLKKFLANDLRSGDILFDR